MVGPFIFFDELVPDEFSVGQGIDVRPHPHINLATVTYLFDGEIIHRDSLGTMMPIRPCAVNWMRSKSLPRRVDLDAIELRPRRPAPRSTLNNRQ
jgi:redox-sensitive bicupin YhaK (pirin superfamily)